LSTPPALPPSLRTWLFETVMPFWANVGVDRAHGGFVERLTRDRKPADDDYKRIRVQARQIYAFSHAHLLGAPAWALDTARAGFDWLVAHGWNAEGGGWHHLLTRAGDPLDRRQDTYDHAFILMALSWFHRASGDRAALDWMQRTIDHLDARMAEPAHGGYREEAGSGSGPLPRRQNPHMHLFEAFLAAHEATGDGFWLARARGIADLFLDRFLDRATGTLGEYFTADWLPAPGAEGSVREPGHHFEWVWLLHQYRRLSGDERVTDAADTLYRFALDKGRDEAPGMVPATLDEVDPEGRILKDTKRLWPQTEAVKAHLARLEVLGDREAGRRAEADIAMMFTHYIGADHAVWRDQLSRDGDEVSSHIPASSLYHLFLCMAEAMRILSR